MTSYCILFIFSFLAATILPFSSETILYALIDQERSGIMLVGVATAGNTLGALVNWFLGYFLLRYHDRKWFYFSREQAAKAQSWFHRYGMWSLLFAWLPLVGDSLTFIAGVMKVRILPFVMLVGAGKMMRYIAILYLAELTNLS